MEPTLPFNVQLALQGIGFRHEDNIRVIKGNLLNVLLMGAVFSWELLKDRFNVIETKIWNFM